MAVRFKIFLGALGFLIITLTLGFFSRTQEVELGSLAVDVYDHALVAVTYVQKVQTDFVRLASGQRAGMPFASAEARLELGELLEDMDVAADQAITPRGRALAHQVRNEILQLRKPVARDRMVAYLNVIDTDLSRLVRKYRADGFVYRVKVDEIIASTNRWLFVALGVATVLTLATTFLLGRAIVPPIRHAVSIATAIAGGKLDNRISARGRSETAQLLASLARMQDAIAESVRQAETLRLSEAARLSAEFESETARRGNRAKSEFLATMSHELRTPLNAILGFSEVIEQEMMGPVSAQYVGYARDIHASGNHLLALINDVLDLSKLEAGKFEIREAPVDLSALVSGTVAVIRSQAQKSRIEIRETLHKEMSFVLADERLLKQALLNLLSNAVKFTPPLGWIQVTSRFSSAGNVEVEVRDGGIGMTPEELEIALTPFGQVDSKISRQHKGTGLGLPISKSFMQAHGGDLRIESAPGAGTTVVLELPRNRILEHAA